MLEGPGSLLALFAATRAGTAAYGFPGVDTRQGLRAGISSLVSPQRRPFIGQVSPGRVSHTAVPAAAGVGPRLGAWLIALSVIAGCMALVFAARRYRLNNVLAAHGRSTPVIRPRPPAEARPTGAAARPVRSGGPTGTQGVQPHVANRSVIPGLPPFGRRSLSGRPKEAGPNGKPSGRAGEAAPGRRRGTALAVTIALTLGLMWGLLYFVSLDLITRR
jgi:hypothetical protein